MLICISILIIAFVWLLIETNNLTVRLPMGKAKSNEYINALTLMLNDNLISIDRHLVIKLNVPQLPQFCERTRFDKQFKDSRYKPSYNGCRAFRESIQTMWFGRTVVRLVATNQNLHELIEEIKKVQTEKHKPKQITMKFPSMPLIEKCRIGSRKVIHNKPNGGYWSVIVEDYKTVFHDCLCGKEWLEAHYKDEYPEPTMELSIDGKEPFHVNGNYKKGLISDFIKSDKKQLKLSV